MFSLSPKSLHIRWLTTLVTTWVTLSQVPGLPASAERRDTRRKRQLSLVVASRSSFHSLRTRTPPCPPSSRTSAASITTFTSALAAVTFLTHSHISYLCSPAGRGIPDIALQAMGYRTVLNGRPWIMDGTSGAAPVRSFFSKPSPFWILPPRASC